MIGRAHRLTVVLAVTVLGAACAQSATPSTDAPAGSSVTSPPTSTTTSPTTTQPAPTPTEVVDAAEGSGCAPGSGPLGDGRWFGYVVATSETTGEFDLACWFTGEQAERAAAEDGEESPPPNDYYVRNVNEEVRSFAVDADAEVVWYPQFGDPGSETTIDYPAWRAALEDRDYVPGVWLDVVDGVVVDVHEQWVP